MDKLNVIIADNQSLTRIGIIAVLSKQFNSNIKIEEASNKKGLFEKLSAIQPKALVLDFQLFDIEISDLAEIKNLSPNTYMLVVTDNLPHEDLYKLLDIGVTNLILKSCEERELIEAFNAAIAGRKYFCNEVLDLLLERKSVSRQVPEPGKLTTAEIEIVRMISQGLTTKEIALQKHLSFHTIITHRKNIFRKLGISNTSELLMYAMRAGIIDSTEYYI